MVSVLHTIASCAAELQAGICSSACGLGVQGESCCLRMMGRKGKQHTKSCEVLKWPGIIVTCHMKQNISYSVYPPFAEVRNCQVVFVITFWEDTVPHTQWTLSVLAVGIYTAYFVNFVPPLTEVLPSSCFSPWCKHRTTYHCRECESVCTCITLLGFHAHACCYLILRPVL